MPTQTQNGGETVTRTGGTRGESVATTLQSGYILRGGYPRSNEISTKMRNVGPLKYTLIAATAAAEAKHSGRRSRRSCLFLTMEGGSGRPTQRIHTQRQCHTGEMWPNTHPPYAIGLILKTGLMTILIMATKEPPGTQNQKMATKECNQPGTQNFEMATKE